MRQNQPARLKTKRKQMLMPDVSTMYNLDNLFQPFSCGSLDLANRIVLAPMTRMFSPGNIPGDDVAAYYRRRAENGVGLIVTEGTWINCAGAGNIPDVPNFHGDQALAGWKRVADEVHAAGGKIAPQLWHTGLCAWEGGETVEMLSTSDISHKKSPSGYAAAGKQVKEGMTGTEVEHLIEAYGEGAADAKRLGFDAIEIHAAHGYLVDQFFWGETNKRSDRWGGKTLAERATFGADLVRACRAAVGPDFPILFRFSQWKLQDYSARLTSDPAELEAMLGVLVDAGVDIFHASQRRFWEPEFEGSPLNLAGWTKKLSGKPSITVGSVGLELDFLQTFGAKQDDGAIRFDQLMEMFDRGDFDLVAIGRVLLADPDWLNKIRDGRLEELKPYSAEAMKTLY